VPFETALNAPDNPNTRTLDKNRSVKLGFEKESGKINLKPTPSSDQAQKGSLPTGSHDVPRILYASKKKEH
jgi:hypothetical protein